MIGQTISHYNILERLGEGGMGVVYKAQDTKLDRLVALKFLPANLAASQEEIARFHQEAKAISALNHPNIATLYDFDEVNGQRFLVLEYIPGGTLKSRLKQLKSEDREFSVAEVIDYGIQMSEGLAHAHKHQIVHRDVKTENMMLTEEGKVKLTDFGLAKLRGGVQITKSGSTLGTAAYMSPEQIRGEEADNRSDIFSLGVVLYEITTSHLPFSGDYEAALSYSILNENPPSVKSVRSDAPPELEQFISHCLEKEESKRYQSTDEIAAELRKMQREISGTVKTVVKQSRLPWIIAAAVIVLALIGVFLFYPKSTTSSNSKTIAVLPFNNLSGSQEDEYFSDGIMEDILTQLSKIGDLNVISRTSVMQYKGTKKLLKEIGKELGAGVLLEGSVRRSGNRIRIVSQLIDAQTDKHIWADTYDREMKDVFVIQSDVAEKIASALKAKLSPAEKERIEKKPTDNIDAYGYYLKGRDYYYRYKKQDNETAIELFKRAIELDANYALAWAGLGDAYGQRPVLFSFDVSWLDSSIAASKKALALDANSAEAYKALGVAYLYKGFMNRSLEANLKAVELNPNYNTAVANIGVTYLNKGELDKAFVWTKKTIVISPTFVRFHLGLGQIYLVLGDLERADELLKKGLELQPGDVETSYYMACLYVLEGKDQQAKDQMKAAVISNPENSRVLDYAGQIAGYTGDFALAKQYYRSAIQVNTSFDTDPYATSGIGLGQILLRDGERSEAEKLLAKAANLQEKQVHEGDEYCGAPYFLAGIRSIERKKDDAYTWLQKAIDAGWRDCQLALRDPWLENLRDDERFRQMMAQVKAKLDEMRKRVEEIEKK
jgi:serine/threonine protein kinase/tetratricopeptide (TPR) repeat protein